MIYADIHSRIGIYLINQSSLLRTNASDESLADVNQLLAF